MVKLSISRFFVKLIFKNIFELETAVFDISTQFPQLYLPFLILEEQNKKNSIIQFQIHSSEY